MMQYWTNLNERERWIVSIGGIFLIIYLIYLLIYSPIVTTLANKRQMLQEKKETLAWILQVRQQYLFKRKEQSMSSSKLLTLIATQLNQRPFSNFPHILQQTSIGSIQLSFDKVPYAPFLTWLWNLESTYSYLLKQCTVEKGKPEGVVKVMLVIDANVT